MEIVLATAVVFTLPVYVYVLSKANTLGKIKPIKDEIKKFMEEVYGKGKTE